ncbi:MAG: magnesium transporter CorA family protein [Candidatus Onthovivens sp.]|nr:magnesium transporter CorA family protein [bacterium]MDD7616770.1 magnesium transporter CorA family protein [bacterium]MDY4159800.1 magnesium transporter CorA family protein [Candidatus Onthovivens sp.]
MIKIFQEEDKSLISKEYSFDDEIELESGSWIHIEDPTVDVLNKISKLTGISNTFLLSALDEEESARIDSDDGDTLIVLDTPYIELDTGHFSTAPFIIAYNRSYYVTIQRHNFEIVSELFKRVKIVEPHKHVRLTLNLVYRLATLFIIYLKKINQKTENLENSLRSSTKNKELLELMDTNKTLIYFSTALNGNKGVLTKLLRSQTYKKYESDFDLMEDTQVEMDQAIEMCSISRSVLNSMMDAFGSIINNNVNAIMKTLAVVTIVLSIPTLVASVYGMNFSYLPLSNDPNGFWIMLSVSFVVAILAAVLIILYTRRNKGD